MITFIQLTEPRYISR